VNPPVSPLPPDFQGEPAPGRIPLRKVILAVVLAGAILFFFLLLFAGTVAILREARPGGHATGSALLLPVKREIIRHLHLSHHR
jgi:hypothetical protein